MRHTFAPVAALLFAVALLLTGNGLLGTLIPIRGQLEAFSTLSIGLLGSTYFLGFAAGCYYGPHLVRRVGHIRTFSAMASIVAAVSLGHGLVTLPMPWWVMRVATGFCFAVLYIVIESWLNERSTNENRGTVLSAYLVINLTVITVGQMMMTLSDPAELTLFALASILVSAAVVPVALSGAAAPQPIESVRVRIRRLFRTSPVAFTGCLGVGLANGAFWTLAPLFVQRTGYGVTAVALFMSATVLGGALGQWPVGRLSDHMDRGLLVVWVSAASAMLGVTVILAGHVSLPWLLAAAAGWGALSFPLYAVAVAQANDRAGFNEFVEISSGLLLTYAAGAVLGPMIATVFMNVMEPGGLYAFTAMVHVLLVAFAYALLKRERMRPEQEHIPFTEALQAAQTVSSTFDAEIQESHLEDQKETGDPAPPPAGQ
jgi:MFS family permease